jgi:hypothetical protein
MQDIPRIYIFEELKDHENCSLPFVYYDSTSDFIFQKMKNHPWRTMVSASWRPRRCNRRLTLHVQNPDEATLFYIPFDTRASYWAARCNNRW